MNRSPAQLLVAALLGNSAILTAPPAHASDAVHYAVTAADVRQLDIEYVDQSGRHLLQGVALPWHLDVTTDNAQGPTGNGAQIRADWRPVARPGRWVVVSIDSNGKLLCQNTLDVGMLSKADRQYLTCEATAEV